MYSSNSSWIFQINSDANEAADEDSEQNTRKMWFIFEISRKQSQWTFGQVQFTV